MDRQSDLTSASGPGPEGPEQTPRSPRRRSDRRPPHRNLRIRVGAVVALAIAVGLIAWAVIGGGDNNSSSSSRQTPASGTPTGHIGLTVQGLLDMQATLRQPIYWAGPKPGYTYEFTREANGRVFVRYLPPGIKVGAPGGGYLVIATYPFPDTFKILRDGAKGAGFTVPGGGFGVVDSGYAKSVHMAFPGVDYQIEVYDPSPARALEVASSGRVAPVR